MPGFGPVVDARSRDDLPDNAKKYLDRITSDLGVTAALVSVGPGRGEDIEEVDPFAAR